MNHIPMRVIASPAVRPAKPTRRALAKQRTREKVLAAARQLFTERGYEGATIRDIAKAAGMSTGAVFASFADKSELFDEILAQDYALLGEAMQDAANGGETVEKALTDLFSVAYRFHMSQLPLLQAGISASWLIAAIMAGVSRWASWSSRRSVTAKMVCCSGVQRSKPELNGRTV